MTPHAAEIAPARTLVPSRARWALAAAGGLVLILLVCWYLAFHNVSVARADAHAYFTFVGLGLTHGGLAAVAHWITALCNPEPYVYLAAMPVIVALLRRRWALALALLVMIPAAVLSAETLKPLLAHPRPAFGVGPTPISGQGSWPSGHSTAAMVLALAWLLSSPARWRPYVAVAGSLFALAIIYSVLALGWHYPSDALGGVLVASIWCLLGVAAVWMADARYGRDLSALAGERTHWLVHMPSVPAMVLSAAVPAVVVMLWRGAEVLAYAGRHTSFVAAAGAIGAVVMLGPSILAVALSGNDRAARAAHPVRWRPG